ncbi:reverse transcriptase zinc-binding domain-containing protein [Artemisia annua]|uniref:Reverse transcriptase zinc-binding domain-containing protein n=1 Tax=Artemisia annua TaxID=35608 RepID=A0A2U1PEL8_ARTAN|nr:reverse transcriptase zinc-binding domain-containing protein [Artemisia annua]
MRIRVNPIWCFDDEPVIEIERFWSDSRFDENELVMVDNYKHGIVIPLNFPVGGGILGRFSSSVFKWCRSRWSSDINNKLILKGGFGESVRKYITNFPPKWDSKNLWEWCMVHDKLVDVYIANKMSKVGKRFGFIRFMGVGDEVEFTKKLSFEWIGSYHVYVSVARFKRSYTNRRERPGMAKHTPMVNNHGIRSQASYAKVVAGKEQADSVPRSKDIRDASLKSVNLEDKYLITLDDSAEMVLAKVREVETMEKLYSVLEYEGFTDVDIHHAGGLWVWIAFKNQSASTRWCSSLPRKVNIFMWRARLDKLPTRYNLSRKGIEIASIMCPVCGVSMESLSHVLFTCTLAKEVWTRVYNWCQVTVKDMNDFSEWLDWCDENANVRNRKVKLEVIGVSTCWFLWRYRNSVIFDSGKIRKRDLVDNIILYSFNWLKSRNPKSCISWVEWLQNPLYLY